MGSTAVLWHRDGARVQMEKMVLLKSVNGIHLINQERIKTTRNHTRPQTTLNYENKQKKGKHTWSSGQGRQNDTFPAGHYVALRSWHLTKIPFYYSTGHDSLHITVFYYPATNWSTYDSLLVTPKNDISQLDHFLSFRAPIPSPSTSSTSLSLFPSPLEGRSFYSVSHRS